MKSYTDIEQSKKLAEILPIESADMFYTSLNRDYPWIWIDKHLIEVDDIPCWSLAALLYVLREIAHSIDEDGSVRLESYKAAEWDLGIDNSDLELITESNPVDAAFEMIVRLKEQGVI